MVVAMTAAAPATRGRVDARGSTAPMPGDERTEAITTLIDALPMAAGIFSLNNGKLWCDAVNARFYDMAGCDGDPADFVSYFKRYASGAGGDFIRAYLADPDNAPVTPSVPVLETTPPELF